MRPAVTALALVTVVLALPVVGLAHHGSDDGGFPWSLVGVLALVLVLVVVWVVSSRLEARRARDAEGTVRAGEDE